ncbi:MAG: hypothetical protein AAB740_01195, partial [Patescibacteria group bacterium]
MTNLRLPTEKAHGKQIMETCNAMAGQGVDMTLLIPRRVNPLKENAFSFYGLQPSFSIRKVFCVDLLFLPFLKKFFFGLENSSFTISSFLNVFLGSGRQYEIIYTRDLAVAFFLSWLKPVVYEIHNLPDNPGFFSRWAWQRARHIIVISLGLRGDLV